MFWAEIKSSAIFVSNFHHFYSHNASIFVLIDLQDFFSLWGEGAWGGGKNKKTDKFGSVNFCLQNMESRQIKKIKSKTAILFF